MMVDVEIAVEDEELVLTEDFVAVGGLADTVSPFSRKTPFL